MVAIVAPPSGRADDPAVAIRPGLRLSSDARRTGTALLNQQFWLWGQDIRRPEGNALRLRGFAQERPPEGLRGSTRYELSLDADRVVVLWGFGLFYGDRAIGGLSLGRFRLAPRLGDPDPPRGVWEPSRLPRFEAPRGPDDWRRAGALLVSALGWIGRYEAWVLASLGEEYRHRCLAPWPRPACDATATAARWDRLAYRCDATLRRAALRGRVGREGPNGNR